MRRIIEQVSISVALGLLASCGAETQQGAGPGGAQSVTQNPVEDAGTPAHAPGADSTTTDPCEVLRAADVRSGTTVAYGPGLVARRPEGVSCTYTRLGGDGTISVSLYTQEQLDRDRRQDPNIPYEDLRGLLEHTKALAESDDSTYARSTDLGMPGYEITSTEAGETDRLAVLAGDNLVVLAVSDPLVSIATVREWMRLAISRL